MLSPQRYYSVTGSKSEKREIAAQLAIHSMTTVKLLVIHNTIETIMTMLFIKRQSTTIKMNQETLLHNYILYRRKGCGDEATIMSQFLKLSCIMLRLLQLLRSTLLPSWPESSDFDL